MTIKEKLTAIAQKQQDVFDAGRISMLNPNQDLRAITSGAFVALHDVLPIEHNVNVTLSSETITDFSNMQVKQFGKNLCPAITKEQTMNGVTFTPNKNGTIATSGTATIDFNFVIAVDLPYFPIGTTIALSGCPQGGSSTTYSLFLSWVGTHEYGNGCQYPIRTNTEATNWRKALCITIKSGVNMDGLIFKPQIEIEHITEYEPFKGCATHAVNADGVVTGMKSIAPNMTLVSEADDVIINCSYKQDVYEAGKAKRDYEWWTTYQSPRGSAFDGVNRYWRMAFAGECWRDEIYNPITDIVAEQSSDDMYAYSGITDTKVSIDLRGTNASSRYTFRYSSLVTIRKLIVYEDTKMSLQFKGCEALKDITIEGTIGTKVDFGDCPYLSRKSIENVFDCLGTPTAATTMTFTDFAVNVAFETSTGAHDGTSSPEWLAFVAEAEDKNWTVTLVEWEE